MASYDVPEHSPLEKIDELLELVEKGIYSFTESISRINDKLLPEIVTKEQTAEDQEKVQPRGWFTEKVCRLEHIQSLVRKANKEAMRLKNNVLENVPVKSTAEQT